MIQAIVTAVRRAVVAAGLTRRSGKWPRVEKAHLRREPTCRNVRCWTATNLNVHHVVPFHERPDMELDEANLITLCRTCHWWLGHNGHSWSDWNPKVREHADFGIDPATFAKPRGPR